MRILYIDIDTLRPDHLGCYGYHRNTSPNLDRIAAQGVRFENCYASDAPCLPSRSALMSGTFGIHNGVINHDGINADFRPEGRRRRFFSQFSRSTLPAVLKFKGGMNTVYIGGFGERHSTFNYYAGFREIYDTGKGGNERAEDVTPTVMDWLERNGSSDNWYLHVNYWDPHTPYRAPAEMGNPFEEEPLPEWLTPELIDDQLKNTVGPHGIHEIHMYDDYQSPDLPRQLGKITNFEDARKVIDGYDCGIRHVDSHIGMLLDWLEARGLMEDLAIIVSSDHGENLGELGLWSEHATADHITGRIPMIIKFPGCRQNAADSGLHYNIDLLPTLTDLLQLEAPAHWDGASFAAAMNGEEADACGRESLIISQCCHGCQRSVRWGDWLYLRTWHDFFHLFPKEMLFNLADDPHEQKNLADEKPEICAEATRKYLEWHDEMMMTQPEGYCHDPLWEVMLCGGPCHSHGHLGHYCERLEATGRGWAADELKLRHPEEFDGRNHL